MANEFKIKKGLIVTGASGGTVVDIQGSQGQLFSVTDDLSGSIFAVSDISGVPIFDVNSSGLSTFDGNVNLPDNNKLLLGTGNDLEIYHNGSDSYIKDAGAGDLRIVASKTRIYDADLSHLQAQFTDGGSVDLYYSGNKKFETTSTGVSVTGSLVVSNDITATGDLDIRDIDARNLTLSGKGTSAATITSDGSSTLTTKGYVNSLITGATIYRGTWDPDVSLNSGYGNPNLNTVTQTSGYYYICSADGTATPNGPGTGPNTWNVGDWVIWNDDLGTSGEWQKIDNSSVLSGVGTGQTVALWEGPNTVTDSETLGNAPITVSGSDTTFAGNVILDDGSGASPAIEFINSNNDSWSIFNGAQGVFNIREGNIDRLEFAAGGNATFAGTVTVGTGIINNSIGGDIAITQGAIGLRINDSASAISPTTASANNDNAVDLGVSNIRFKNLYLGGSITSGGGATFAGNITVGDSHFIGDDSNDNLLIQSSANENVIINSPDDDVLIRTAGTTRLQITNTLATFSGLVSGITPVNAANFVTKAYVDGSGGGTGPFLPLAGGTLTGALAGTSASFTGSVTAGSGSGSVALTVNDGGGNANVTFNHANETPDVNGNSFRIRANVDSSSGAAMVFELKEGVTAGTQVTTLERFRIDNTGAKVRNPSSGVLDLQRDDTSVVASNALGKLRFMADDPTNGSFNIGAEIKAKAEAAWSTDNYPSRLEFYTTTTDTSILALTIDKDQDATFAGSITFNGTLNSTGNLILSTASAGANIEMYTDGNMYYDAVSHNFRDSDASPTYFNITASQVNSFVSLAMNNYKITTLATPTNAADAATKAYVDAHGGGLGPFLPLSAGSSYPLTGDLYTGTFAINTRRLNISSFTAGAGLVMNYGNASGTVEFISLQSNGVTSPIKLQMRQSPNESDLILAGSSGNGLTLTSASNALFAGKVAVNGTSIFADAELDVLGDITLINRNWALRGNNSNADFVIEKVAGNNFNDNNIAVTVSQFKNVGIGTTSPAAKLHVSGSVQLDVMPTNESEGSIKIGRYDANTSRYNLIKNFVSATAASNYMRFAVHNGTENATVDVMSLNGAGNVGIGTVSPQTNLHINNDTSNSYATLRLEGANRGGIIEMYNQTSYPVSSWTTDQSGNIFFATSGAFAATSLSTKFTILTGGRVGIGTTNPSRDGLNIFHSTLPYVHLTNTTTGDLNSDGGYMSMSGIDLRLGNQEAGGPLVLFTNNDSGNGIIILSNGNVGIGETNPTYKFEVRGSGTNTLQRWTTTEGGALLLIPANDAANPDWTFIAGTNENIQIDPANNDSGLIVKYNGNVGIGTTTPLAKLDIQGTQGQLFSVTDDLSGSIFAVADISGVPIFDVNSSGVSYFDGNVGIGETTPNCKLDVKGVVNTTIIAATTLGDGGGAANRGLAIRTLTDGGEITTVGSSTNMYLDTGNNLYLQNAGNTKVTMLANGNVGIGLTNPGQKLEVAGNIIANDGYIRSEDGATGDFMQMFNDGVNTGQSFITTSSTELVLIPQNGKLQLKGENSGSGNNASLEIYNALNAAVKVKLNSSGVSYFNGGNVGINQDNPLTRLDVIGSLSGSTAQQFNTRTATPPSDSTAIFRNGGNSSITILGDNQAASNTFGSLNFGIWSDMTDGQIIYSFQDQFMVFSTANSEKLRIESGGEVGINETSPSATLHLQALASNGVPFKLVGDPATSTVQQLIRTTQNYTSSTAWYNIVCEAANASNTIVSTFIVERDGDVRNINNSYGQISDSRLKENIQDATPKLDDIMKVKVKNFNFIGDELKQIGVVAQELEEVFPGLVKENEQPGPDGTKGGVYKSVKYSVLVPILVKAMQEQQEIIEDLKTRLTQLENNN